MIDVSRGRGQLRHPAGVRDCGGNRNPVAARLRRLPPANLRYASGVLLGSRCWSRREWKSHDDYSVAFDRLVHDLKKSQPPIIMKGG